MCSTTLYPFYFKNKAQWVETAPPKECPVTIIEALECFFIIYYNLDNTMSYYDYQTLKNPLCTLQSLQL